MHQKVLSMILVLVMLLGLLSVSAFTVTDTTSSDSADSTEFMRIFHLDCGRKYFSVDQIKDLIKAASASNYTHVELAIGNDALRFLLDDMSVTAYSSEKVKMGIQKGNKNYYDAGSKNELTQSEMNEIIDYAKAKNISIIPLLNSPGHMDAIIDCMKYLGMNNVAYNNSKRTISLTNTDAAAFTKALIEKYVKYFASKGCKYFNMGADEYANDVSNGFAELINNNTYGYFVTYVNEVAGIIETAGMTPIAFNDGIYYKSNMNFGTFDKNIVISYWTSGWDGYSPASASFLAGKEHKIINTNDAWYYVLNNANSSYTYSHALSGVKGTAVTDVPGSNDPTPMGCMLAFWCDSPSAQYNDTEAKNVKGLISTLAANNKAYFTTVSPAEPEILTSTGSTTLDVNGGRTTLSVSNGAEATWTVDPSDGSVIQLISASNADGDSITGSRVEAVATGKGTATITATVGTKTYTMKLTVADPNEVTVEVPAGSDWTTTVKDVDLRNQVGDYDERVATVKVSYDQKDGGITVTPVTSVSDGTAYYIQNSNGEYLDKDANWVADSASAAEWTWDGYYLSCDGSYLYYSSSKWTTSTRRATQLYFNNGMFYRSRSWDYWNDYYTYSNPLGQPGSGTKADPVNASTITITGVTAGQETTVKIGEVTYRIKVTDKAPSNAMTDTSIKLEYWITNYPVYPSYSGDYPSGNAYREVSSTEASSDDGIAIATETIAPDHAYSFFDGRKDVYYWQAMRLDAGNKQTDGLSVDQTAVGTTLTHIRYHGGAWQYKTTDGVWHYFVSTDQLVAYYLQNTKVTKEIETYVKDWGYVPSNDYTDELITNANAGSVALTVAVVYPDGTVSPAEGTMYANSTTIFNYWSGRDIGIVAPKNNSDYNISKITVTDGRRTRGDVSGSDKWHSTSHSQPDSITWDKTTDSATGKTWDDEKLVWDKSDGTTPMVNGKTAEITWSAKNKAKLVLIYLETVTKETNLNVVYWDDNAGTEIVSSQIAMSYKNGDPMPSFMTALKDANDKTNWPSKDPNSDEYLPDTAYVTNSSGVPQHFNKDLLTVSGVTGIYASGLYEYVSANISDGGKTLVLHYNLKQTGDKTYVLDFGLPIKIPAKDFGIENYNSVASISFDSSDATVKEKPGEYGKGNIDTSDGSVTYTLTKAIDSKVAIPIYVTFKNSNTTKRLQVYVIPATSVYYEDSFASFTDGKVSAADAKWTPETDDTAPKVTTTQALTELGKMSPDDVYGHDAAYADSTKLSMGSAHKVTVSANMVDGWTDGSAWPTATFTFRGTGFDVISLTDNNSGAIAVDIYNKNTGKRVKGYVVNNYYGYTYNEKTQTWEVNNNTEDNALYQIPVMKVNGLTYGEYTVKISVAYDSNFDKTGDRQFSFWLDAIRVYDPMDKDNVTYTKDGEGYPQYIKLRDALVGSTAQSKAVFIDGGPEANVDTYKNYGPNNEVYLAKDQAIAFNVPEGKNIASVQIGAKAPDGNNAAKMNVNGVDTVISSATEMYYKIGTGGSFTIVNKGDGILSLTNLKITFNDKPDSTITLTPLSKEEQNAVVTSVRALFAAPAEPFQPDRFEASWGHAVRKGDTATLTVKTSEDVDSITVDGQTITTYDTKTERTGWGWWAKTVTYREFTYQVSAEETTDYTICAVNSAGVSSDPITATLTVRPSVRDWWHGIFDKWF